VDVPAPGSGRARGSWACAGRPPLGHTRARLRVRRGDHDERRRGPRHRSREPSERPRETAGDGGGDGEDVATTPPGRGRARAPRDRAARMGRSRDRGGLPDDRVDLFRPTRPVLLPDVPRAAGTRRRVRARAVLPRDRRRRSDAEHDRRVARRRALLPVRRPDQPEGLPRPGGTRATGSRRCSCASGRTRRARSASRRS
jgi:hypothetical protein